MTHDERLKKAIPGARLETRDDSRPMLNMLSGEVEGGVYDVSWAVVDAKRNALAVGWTQKEAVDRAIFLWGPK